MDTTGAVQARPLGGEPKQTGDREARRASLEKAAKEFEALFVGTLMRAMRSTVPEGGLIDDGGEIKYYRQLHDEQLAQSVTGGDGGLGIADLVVEQFDRRYDSVEQRRAGGPVSEGERALALERYYDAGAKTKAREMNGLDAAMKRLDSLAGRAGTTVADSLRLYEDAIRSAAAESGVDPALILSVLVRESGGDAEAVSGAGAQGLMQLMPATAAEVGVTETFDPEENIRGGARYLASMLRRFDSDLELSLAAYNAGPGTVERAGNAVPPYSETRNYVEKVSGLYGELGGGADTALVR